MFHSVDVSLSDIFGIVVVIAPYWSIARKLSLQSFFVCKIEIAVPKISDDDTAAQ